MQQFKQKVFFVMYEKILNVLLLYVTPNYVFCLSYEFRKLPDNFLTIILKNDFFVGYDGVYYIT